MTLGNPKTYVEKYFKKTRVIAVIFWSPRDTYSKLSSYELLSVLYQIVFCPKYRNPCLIKENRERLFAYMAGIISQHNSKPYIINGVEDHLHILTHVHQTVPLASLVKQVKISSNKLIKSERLFPEFTEWQTGYSAFSYAFEAKENLFRYIQRQEQHHQGEDYKEELIHMLKQANIEYDEKYLFA